MKRTLVRIFQGIGFDGIVEVEQEMGDYISSSEAGGERLIDIKMSSCTVSDGPDGERYQALVAIVITETDLSGD